MSAAGREFIPYEVPMNEPGFYSPTESKTMRPAPESFVRTCSTAGAELRKRLFGEKEIPHSVVLQPSDFSLGPIPGDGNCLFASMIVAYFYPPGKGWPSKESIVSMGRKCREQYLKKLSERIKSGSAWLGEVSILVALEASSSLTLKEYELSMQEPNAYDKKSWGGFFEATFMARLWKRRVAIFEMNADKSLALITQVGQDNAEILNIVWTGSHFNVVRRH